MKNFEYNRFPQICLLASLFLLSFATLSFSGNETVRNNIGVTKLRLNLMAKQSSSTVINNAEFLNSFIRKTFNAFFLLNNLTISSETFFGSDACKTPAITNIQKLANQNVRYLLCPTLTFSDSYTVLSTNIRDLETSKFQYVESKTSLSTKEFINLAKNQRNTKTFLNLFNNLFAQIPMDWFFNPNNTDSSIIKIHQNISHHEKFQILILFSQTASSMSGLEHMLNNLPKTLHDFTAMHPKIKLEVGFFEIQSQYWSGFFSSKNLKQMKRKYFSTLPQKQNVTTTILQTISHVINKIRWSPNSRAQGFIFLMSSGMDQNTNQNLQTFKKNSCPLVIIPPIGDKKSNNHVMQQKIHAGLKQTAMIKKKFQGSCLALQERLEYWSTIHANSDSIFHLLNHHWNGSFMLTQKLSTKNESKKLTIALKKFIQPFINEEQQTLFSNTQSFVKESNWPFALTQAISKIGNNLQKYKQINTQKWRLDQTEQLIQMAQDKNIVLHSFNAYNISKHLQQTLIQTSRNLMGKHWHPIYLFSQTKEKHSLLCHKNQIHILDSFKINSTNQFLNLRSIPPNLHAEATNIFLFPKYFLPNFNHASTTKTNWITKNNINHLISNILHSSSKNISPRIQQITQHIPKDEKTKTIKILVHLDNWTSLIWLSFQFDPDHADNFQFALHNLLKHPENPRFLIATRILSISMGTDNIPIWHLASTHFLQPNLNNQISDLAKPKESFSTSHQQLTTGGLSSKHKWFLFGNLIFHPK